MRRVDIRDAGLVAVACVSAIVSLQFIGLELYAVALPALLVVAVCLCLLRRENLPLQFLLVPAVATTGTVFALNAAGLTFPAAFVAGLALLGAMAAAWYGRRRLGMRRA